MKLAEHQRIALWTPLGRSGFQDRFLVYAGRAPSLKWNPHQDSNLEPPPLEAARADSPLHLVGILKLVDSDGNAPSPAVCKTAVLPSITTSP